MSALYADHQPDQPVSTDLSADLVDLVERLQAPRARIEDTFLGLGDALSQSSDLLGRITERLDAMPREVQGERVREATARLERLTAVARKVGEVLDAEQDGLRRLGVLLARVHQPMGELASTVRAIGIVALNARVAAGYIAGHGDLAAFTGDISQLARRAADTVKQVSGVHDRLVPALRAAEAVRNGFEAEHKDAMSEVVGRLDHSLAQAARQRGQAAAVGGQLAVLSRRIGEQVGKAVVSLQVGDATRQRLEHVEQAFTALSAAPTDGPDGQALAGAVCRLQAAQLAQAMETFDREVGELFGALKGLARMAGENVEHSRAAFGAAGGASGSGGRSFLVEMAEELRQACRLMRHAQAACARLDETARAVADAVTELVRHIEDVQAIEFEMRLVSFNMTLKCSKLGVEGRTLKVIAHELGEVVGHTVAAAEGVIAPLREAAEVAEAMRSAGAEDVTGKVSNLEGEAEAAIAVLEAVDDGLQQALGSVVEDGAQVRAMLDAAAAGAVLRVEIGEAARAVLADVRAMADAPERQGDVDPEAIAAVVGRRYTMRSERDLHSQLLTGAAADEPDADADVDDVFF